MTTLKSTLLSIILTLSLSSCSASPWSLLKPDSGLSVDTEIVAGDKEQTVEVGDDTTQNAAKISNVYNKLPWWQWILIVLMAGWAIPTPWAMFVGMVNGVRFIFGRKKLE